MIYKIPISLFFFFVLSFSPFLIFSLPNEWPHWVTTFKQLHGSSGARRSEAIWKQYREGRPVCWRSWSVGKEECELGWLGLVRRGPRRGVRPAGCGNLKAGGVAILIATSPLLSNFLTGAELDGDGWSDAPNYKRRWLDMARGLGVEPHCSRTNRSPP